jgi:flap endonuclease-1
MGIKKMLKFLNTNFPKTINKIDDTDFGYKMIAIDISILLYQVIIAVRNSGADMLNNQGDISSHILGLFNKTINMLNMKIIPIYVFDGKPPEFKNKTINNRKEIKQKAVDKLSNEDMNEEDKIKYFKRTVNINKKQIDECIELLEIMGIPYIIAPEEADSQCAELVKCGIADGVLTDDMDILTFGSNKIYRNLTSYKKDKMIIMKDVVLNELQLNYEQFVELCILFGCDYCDRLRDIKPEIIYNYFMKTKNLLKTVELMKKDGYYIPDMSDYQIYKDYFMNPPVINTNINIKMKKCNINDLEKLLVNKYGLVKMKIYNKIKFLEEFNVS